MNLTGRKILNGWNLVSTMIKYNMKIIFANRFIWFFLVAFIIFVGIAVIAVFDNNNIGQGFIYGSLILPGVLLLFYPTVFGIQNDEDARVLEILFGIPDYRYKVWLVRLVMTFIFLYLIMVFFSWLASVGLYRINVFEMAGQLMFPLFFIGALAFMLSTLIKNGNGTAVMIVIIGIAILILQELIYRSMWNVFHNPFDIPRNMNEVLWHRITLKNRLFLVNGAIVFLLMGLFKLQKREKFIK